MKLAALAVTAALLALAPAAQAQTAFRTVKVTRDYTSGPRAGTRTSLSVAMNGAVTFTLRDATGARSTTSQATPAQLLAVRAAFRGALVSTLPQTIVDLTELQSVASQELESFILPTNQRKVCRSDLGRYGSFRGRVEPLVRALDALALEPEARLRAGFRSIALVTRATAGPTIGATSRVALGADRAARLERRLPGAGLRTDEGQATPAELERVAAALRDARLATVPDGFVLDPRELLTLSRVELQVVLLDGTTRTISARRGLYGPHRLASLVDAVEAIGERLATTSTGGLTGGVPD